MSEIENKFYKIEIPLDNKEHFCNQYNVSLDYKQYFYVNYVTCDEYCYMPDGSFANNSMFNGNIHNNSETFKKNKALFVACSLYVQNNYKEEFEQGFNYAAQHNIPLAKWKQEAILLNNDLHNETMNTYMITINVKNNHIDDLLKLDSSLDENINHMNKTTTNVNYNADIIMPSIINDEDDMNIMMRMFDYNIKVSDMNILTKGNDND